MKAQDFIREYTKGCSNELIAVEDKYGKEVISYHEWLTPEQALRAVEIAREELIDKASKWIGSHFLSPETAGFLDEFKEAMENYDL